MSSAADDEKIQISHDLVQRLKNYMNDPVYKEAVENSSSYNERLVKERKLRLPFIDAQTGVAQSDCYIWSSKLDRMPGYYSAQLYSYPARRWRKKRRQYLLNETYSNSVAQLKDSEQNSNDNLIAALGGGSSGASGGPSGLLQDSSNPNATISNYNNTNIVQNGNCIGISNSNSNSALNDMFDDSKDSWMRYEDDASDLPDAGELDDPESDYDDYEEYSSRKKKSKRKQETTVKKKRTEYSDHEKPFHCELCGARYKTRPGLSYHYTHSHQDNNNSSNGALSGNGSIPEEESYFSSVKGGSHHLHGHHQHSGNNHNMQQSTTSNTNNHSSSNTSHFNSISNSSQSSHSLQSNHLTNNSSTNRTITSDDKLDRKDKTANKQNSSSNTTSSSSTTSAANKRASPSNYCDFCLGDSSENKKTQEAEDLVSCSDCGRSAHPSCLQFTANMILSVKKYRWQCIECKSCGLCGTSDNDDQLLFCDDCDRGYHMYCLKPPLTEPPEGSWSCHLCIEEYHMPNKNNNNNNKDNTDNNSSNKDKDDSVK